MSQQVRRKISLTAETKVCSLMYKTKSDPEGALFPVIFPTKVLRLEMFGTSLDKESTVSNASMAPSTNPKRGGDRHKLAGEAASPPHLCRIKRAKRAKISNRMRCRQIDVRFIARASLPRPEWACPRLDESQHTFRWPIQETTTPCVHQTLAGSLMSWKA